VPKEKRKRNGAAQRGKDAVKQCMAKRARKCSKREG